MQTDSDVHELNIEAAIGVKSVNVYVEEKLDNIERTVCILYYVGKKDLYKHFIYVLSPGKTRLVLSDLMTGTYEVHAIQMSETEKAEGRVRFKYTEPGLDILDYAEDILDRLDEIQHGMEYRSRNNHSNNYNPD